MKLHYKFFWLSLILLLVALFAPIDGKSAGPSLDKVVHFILFFILTLNWRFYFNKKNKFYFLTLLLVVSLPFTTELIQDLIPGRQYDYKDIIADYAGLVFGFVIYSIFKEQLGKLYKFLGEHQKS